MKFGICLLSVIPLRTEPSDMAEMVSQVQFGELVIVNQEQSDWLNIRIVYDNYEGWVDQKQIVIIDKSEFNRLSKINPVFTTDLVEVISVKGKNLVIPVLFGSLLYDLHNGEFEIADRTFQYSGQISTPKSRITSSAILEDALLFLNAPYLWGGKSPFGIDCSGFTQIIFKVNGVELLRDASQQATQGETIGLFDESLPGDLLFFDNPEGEIIHVGILLGDQKIIHASGKVRIDAIDHQGIYNVDFKKYTHNLRLIKRIL
ncbi:MAG: C40 family peptidase [Bacteroidales bacterium]|nr:C40 family peptidase [Bacteroidales bacterium]